jgi:hypothetical protein
MRASDRREDEAVALDDLAGHAQDWLGEDRPGVDEGVETRVAPHKAWYAQSLISIQMTKPASHPLGRLL